jgi:hypothetical protein
LSKEAQAIEYYMTKEQFPRLAQELNPQLDIDDFEDHFSELYKNRFLRVKNDLNKFLPKMIEQERHHDSVKNALDRSVMNLKFDSKSDKILNKFFLYTLAHVKLAITLEELFEVLVDRTYRVYQVELGVDEGEEANSVKLKLK